MGKLAAEINKALDNISERQLSPVMSGKCKSVDEDAATMVVDVNGIEKDFEDVLLNALDGENNGIVIIPKVDTDVVICAVDGSGEYMLVSAGEVDKVLFRSKEIEVEADTVKVTCEDIEFNGGDNKGLVKVVELKDKINALEDQVNNILSALQGVIIPLAPTGTYPFAPLFTQTPLTPTQQADIENDKIKH